MKDSGWLYLIKNGDLYKIGITKNFENRMRQLNPDIVIAKLYSSSFKKLEKELHKRYESVRLPQSEYFRLDYLQIREIKQRISLFYYPNSITYEIIIRSIYLIILIFLLLLVVISLIFDDINQSVIKSLFLMERILIGISFLSLFIKSNKFLSLLNELKFRSSRFVIFNLFAFFFRCSSSLLT